MSIKDILRDKGFKFNKRLGQNFIFDTNLLISIAEDANIQKDDIVVEIGAGAGTLTSVLATKAKKVIAFEIDRSLNDILNVTLSSFNNIQVVFKDFLKCSKSELLEYTGGNFKVVANLPYYITTPIIMKLIEEYYENFESLTIMLQKEVAERLNSNHAKEEYGAITCSVQSRCDVKYLRTVSRNIFYPVPNVDSAIINIIPNKNKYGVSINEGHLKLMKCAFAMRRKTLVNNLANTYSISKTDAENLLLSLKLDTKIRGEAISIETFIAIYDKLSDYVKQ